MEWQWRNIRGQIGGKMFENENTIDYTQQNII